MCFKSENIKVFGRRTIPLMFEKHRMLFYSDSLCLRRDDSDLVLLPASTAGIRMQHGQAQHACSPRRSLPEFGSRTMDTLLHRPLEFLRRLRRTTMHSSSIVRRSAGHSESRLRQVTDERKARMKHRLLGVLRRAERDSTTTGLPRESPSERNQHERSDHEAKDGCNSGRCRGQYRRIRVAPAEDSRDHARSCELADWVRQPDSVQRHRPSFRMSTKRSVEQQKFQENRLRLQDQSLRLAEWTMANRPSGATGSWVSDDELCLDQASCASPTRLLYAIREARSTSSSGTSSAHGDSCRFFAGRCGR